MEHCKGKGKSFFGYVRTSGFFSAEPVDACRCGDHVPTNKRGDNKCETCNYGGEIFKCGGNDCVLFDFCCDYYINVYSITPVATSTITTVTSTATNQPYVLADKL